MQNQGLFHARSSIKDGAFRTDELSGELKQEICHVRYLKELETNLYLVLIFVKAFLPYPVS